MGDELTITLNKGSTPVLLTGEPTIIRAVMDALSVVLEGEPRRQVLRLSRAAAAPKPNPEGAP